MLVLTLTDGTELFVVSEQIATVTSYGATTGSSILISGCKDFYRVRESPIDIARLKAAWELRFTASKLEGELPIAVGMSPEGDAILFRCCQHTAKLRDQAKTARDQLREALRTR